MSGIGGWLGSGAGVVVIGLCVIISIFMGRLPAMTHQWIRRGLILGMYCGGAAILVTPLGSVALRGLDWVAGLIGGTAYGIGYVAVVIAGTFLALTVAVCLIWVPDMTAAYVACVLPLILATVPGGFLHQVYVTTTYPAQAATVSIAHWLGG